MTTAGAGGGLTGGLEYAALVAIFLAFGWILDNALGTGPLFMVILSIAAFVGGFLRIVFAERYDEARRAFRGLPPKPQREVPEVLREREARKGAEGPESGRPLFDSKTGLVSFNDWNPRAYGEAVPPELEEELRVAREEEVRRAAADGAREIIAQELGPESHIGDLGTDTAGEDERS